jgi:hypothetical protein
VTLDKDRKRIIRRRMQKTGESYTTARAHVISKAKVHHAAAPAVDHASLAGMSDGKIAANTGRTWREWVLVLDSDNAAAMPHRNIAALVRTKHGVNDWWAQTVTVGYERIKGLREIGQRRSGEYEINKSKTFRVPVDTLFDAWADGARRRRWLDGVDPKVRTATKPKSMRLQWPDGTVVVVGFTAKGAAKSSAAIAHTKLPDRAASTNMKKYWTERFEALTALVAPDS